MTTRTGDAKIGVCVGWQSLESSRVSARPYGLAGGITRQAGSGIGPVTALDKYAKLEAIARYRDGPSDRVREVVLSFGERTLMIVGLDDQPISHWPLVNVHRLSAEGAETVLLAPFADSPERIELTDPDMIEAIDIVVPRLDAPRARRRRTRPRWGAWLAMIMLGAVAALVWFWPNLMERTVDLVPQDRAKVIGATVRAGALSKIGISEDAAGAVCTEPEGRAALDRLIVMAAGIGPGTGDDAPASLRVTVIDHPAPLAVGLPGGAILLMRGMIETAGTPEALTALLAHEIAHVRARDPMRKILRMATFSEKIAHILGDVIEEPVPDTAVNALLTGAYLPAEETAADAAVTDALNAAKLPSTPYAALLLQLSVSDHPGPHYGDAHPSLKIRASRADATDPIGADPFEPALADRDWLVLQTICGGL